MLTVAWKHASWQLEVLLIRTIGQFHAIHSCQIKESWNIFFKSGGMNFEVIHSQFNEVLNAEQK